MGSNNRFAITPLREQDYSMWYQAVVKAGDMAETSSVRGCMVIKPWGYGVWENIMNQMDSLFKQTGVKNAYFPLFIPLSYMEKEAKHVDGFAKECAVVTHHKLEQDDRKRLKPAGKLTEPLIVRPTSETIIGESMSKWISSYRDLPVLLNQWANVVRWEMRTRMFLRTSEFLWQEGHTAHTNAKEAKARTMLMLDVYTKFVQDYLAIPVIRGQKTIIERFPGAIDTLCVEAMMQDKRALQVGTSHFLGQNFAKSSDIKFQDKQGTIAHAWTTSWGASTRMIGGIIMVHSDDEGLVLPPRIAPAQAVILPVFKKNQNTSDIIKQALSLKKELERQSFHGQKVKIELDDRDTGGTRGWEWLKKGVPIRIEIGKKEIDKNTVFIARRDQKPSDKHSISKESFIKNFSLILDEIQNNLFKRAVNYKKENSFEIDDKEEFYNLYKKAQGFNNGAFVMSHWCSSFECEQKIKQDLSVTIRCIPFDSLEQKGKCIYCNKTSSKRVLFAKAY